MVGLWRVANSAPQRQAGAWVNAGLFVLCAALVGARLFYVLLNWGYFSGHPLEAVMIWLGGLTWPGAVAGAGVALIFLGFRLRSSPDRLPPHTARLPLGWFGDRLYPLLPPLAITAWIGTWQTGVAYGAALPPSNFWAIPTMDQSGAVSLRFPLQPLAALTLLAFYWLLEARFKPLRPAGRLSGLAITGQLLHLLAASLLRADPAPYWNGLRMDAWMAIFSLIFFFTIVLVNNLVLRAGRRATLPNPERSSS